MTIFRKWGMKSLILDHFMSKITMCKIEEYINKANLWAAKVFVFSNLIRLCGHKIVTTHFKYIWSVNSNSIQRKIIVGTTDEL